MGEGKSAENQNQNIINLRGENDKRKTDLSCRFLLMDKI